MWDMICLGEKGACSSVSSSFRPIPNKSKAQALRVCILKRHQKNLVLFPKLLLTALVSFAKQILLIS